MKMDEDKYIEEVQAEIDVVADEMASRLRMLSAAPNFGESEDLGDCAEIYEAAQGEVEPFIKLMTETEDVMEKLIACKSLQAYVCILVAMGAIPDLANDLARVCASNRVLERNGCNTRLSLG